MRWVVRIHFCLARPRAVGGWCETVCAQLTAVYLCVRILAEMVAPLSLHVSKVTDSCGRQWALDHLLYPVLHDEPSLQMTSFIFRETLMTHLLLWGNAYAQVIRNGLLVL